MTSAENRLHASDAGRARRGEARRIVNELFLEEGDISTIVRQTSEGRKKRTQEKILRPKVHKVGGRRSASGIRRQP